MVTRQELIVRGTPAHVLSAGEGPPLLFLHGAGAGGRWLSFQEELSRRFTLLCPSHPGHGGSPPAEWIEHISDLAFHYLDLLDELGLERVHLVGASLGGWIGAELATMASHRLRSLVLIDPVGIKVDGWTYPFLFAMDLGQLVATVFHNPAAALPLAPKDESLDTLVELYRERAAMARVAWNPHLYNPWLKRRLPRIAARTLLCWGEHDRVAPLQCAGAWAEAIPGAQLRIFGDSGHLPHVEEPEAVAAAIVEFCEGDKEAR